MLQFAETMGEIRRRSGMPGGVFLVAQALLVGLVCCALRVGAEVKQQMTVTAPFDKYDHKGSRIIPYFEKSGATSIMQSFIRVRGRKKDKRETEREKHSLVSVPVPW